MSDHVWLKGEIVTTGTEILLGQIVDTNAAWIAQRLNAIGINLYYKSTVGDNEERLRELLKVSMTRSNVVIVTGGLGPTADDITREAIASAVGESLVLDQPTVESLRKRFSHWGTRMTANNEQQALIPRNAAIVPNPVGTAPGFRISREGCTLFALPGVPREMKRMMEDHVLPYLQEQTRGQGVIRTRTLRTIGIGESSIDHAIRDLMASDNPTAGLAAHTGQADVRLTARGLTPAEADTLLDAMEAKVRDRIGAYIYSDQKDKDIAEYIADLLKSQGERLAIYEYHTRGLITERLQNAGGATVLDPIWEREPELVAEAAACIPASEEDETAFQQSLSAIAALLTDSSDASCQLVVLGTTGEDHGVYQRRRGFTHVLFRSSRATQNIRFGFGGTDPLTAVWIGNRCFDLMRRNLLELT